MLVNNQHSSVNNITLPTDVLVITDTHDVSFVENKYNGKSFLFQWFLFPFPCFYSHSHSHSSRHSPSLLFPILWSKRTSSRRQISHRNCAVPGGILTADGRCPSIDARACRQSSNAVATAAHHRPTERPPGRVVQEKVGGEVGVEQILEHVLRDEDRIARFVVVVQLRHGEHVDTDYVTGAVAQQKYYRHHQQDLRHLNSNNTHITYTSTVLRSPYRSFSTCHFKKRDILCRDSLFSQSNTFGVDYLEIITDSHVAPIKVKCSKLERTRMSVSLRRLGIFRKIFDGH